MTPSCSQIEATIGLDAAKHSVTLHDLVSGHTLTLDNSHEALLAGLAPFAERTLAVCEATGGYEDTLLCVLLTLGIPAHRADAAKVKAFLRSYGARAKTDAIDARALALYGRERGQALTRWQPADEARNSLAALVERRRDLVAMRAAEKNRRAAPRAHAVRAEIDSHIADLSQRITDLEQRMATLVAENPACTARAAALRSVPGIGTTTALILLASLPELGTLSRGQAASLAGLAPHPRDSGKTRGHRTTTGGRRSLRPVLFCAALAATRTTGPLAAFYRRLLAAGKPKRLALVALMRKIIVIANARVRDLKNTAPQLT